MSLRFADADAALRYFDGLPPVQAGEMLGTWEGEEVASGHPLDGALAAYGWRGKRFDDAEHVHPLLFGNAGHTWAVRPRWVFPGVPLVMRWPALKHPAAAALARMLLPLLATRRSRARLRTVRFRGGTTAAMVYDEVPILDVFRRIDEETVLGVMDLKGMERPYFFVLRRPRAQAMR